MKLGAYLGQALLKAVQDSAVRIQLDLLGRARRIILENKSNRKYFLQLANNGGTMKGKPPYTLHKEELSL